MQSVHVNDARMNARDSLFLKSICKFESSITTRTYRMIPSDWELSEIYAECKGEQRSALILETQLTYLYPQVFQVIVLQIARPTSTYRMIPGKFSKSSPEIHADCTRERCGAWQLGTQLTYHCVQILKTRVLLAPIR